MRLGPLTEHLSSWLSRMDSVVVFGGCISSVDSAMDSE